MQNSEVRSEPYVAPHSCAWTYDADDESGTWETECGHAFCFIDDGPKENDCKFCAYCGGNLVEVIATAEDEDDEA
jgi:rRNA maturation endonuclease Nob1